jgi:predicted DNA-binding transcriptional regulator YafY
MPPLVFTPEEATAVHLGTSLVSEVWGKLYEEAAHGALAKLDNVLPEEQRQEIAWASRALIATNMNRAEHVILMPLLEKLRQATRERRCVRIWYQGRQQPEPVERELDVYALVYSWGWWYAIGFCHLRQATRSFRVDRINELILLSVPFTIPDDFAVHDYLATEPTLRMEIQITMRFQPEGVFLAEYSRSYWNSMETQPDGSLIVTFGAQDLNYAASTIMSYGPLVEVLEPRDLRKVLGEWATAVAGQYIK